MTVHDWVMMMIAVVMTITTIGRWIEAREQKELRATDEIGATRADLADIEKRHTEEHAKIWREIERNRNHWHQELVPKLQQIFERLAGVEAIIERRHRSPRD